MILSIKTQERDARVKACQLRSQRTQPTDLPLQPMSKTDVLLPYTFSKTHLESCSLLLPVCLSVILTSSYSLFFCFFFPNYTLCHLIAFSDLAGFHTSIWLPNCNWQNRVFEILFKTFSNPTCGTTT